MRHSSLIFTVTALVMVAGIAEAAPRKAADMLSPMEFSLPPTSVPVGEVRAHCKFPTEVGTAVVDGSTVRQCEFVCSCEGTTTEFVIKQNVSAKGQCNDVAEYAQTLAAYKCQR